jgi:hypothetical protein|tara:strand:- start:137 stop:376 length:240 start_codon:yes stop_codon:yes gene_type:complete
MKTLGLKNKDGVIYKVKKGTLKYYKGMNDASLMPLFRKGKGGMVQVKSGKVFETIVIANKGYTVTVSPDGSLPFIEVNK